MLREPKLNLDADQIGIDALTFISSHEDLLSRLVDVTGFDASQIRTQAARPEFFVGVLDFILANEPDVLDLANQLALPPTAIGRARNALAKQVGISLEDFPI
jgi:hypothetical protein